MMILVQILRFLFSFIFADQLESFAKGMRS